nr:AAA-ATPase At3g50940-like [Tanacetum cinerariifolium]
MVIYEFDGFQDNEVYNAIELYISGKMFSDIHSMKIMKNPNQKHIAVVMNINEEFTDGYNDVKFYWSIKSKKTPNRSYYSEDGMSHTSRSDLRWMELTFHGDYKDLVLNDYLPFILKDTEMKERKQKTVKLFTVNSSHSRPKWTFVKRREYYRKVGKAWKRDYLLYGPPGTGKSSLIAAMANYMNFDIYDLELADVRSNSDLRTLLLATSNRSILVVEDIDCSRSCMIGGRRMKRPRPKLRKMKKEAKAKKMKEEEELAAKEKGKKDENEID